MKAGITLAAVTLMNLAWQLQPQPGRAIDAVGASTGTPVAEELLPGLESECSLLVFFEPGCPFCGQVADAQRAAGLPDLEVVWVTDDPLGPGRFMDRIPEEAGLLISRDLFRHLAVAGVPAGGWIRDGVLVAAGPLNGAETHADLLAPCGGSEEGPEGARDAPNP